MDNTNFIIGSSYFFKDIEGFEPKDKDVLIIVPNLPKVILNFKKNNEDIFLVRPNKEDLLNDCLNSELAMKAGKFLIPEFCDYIRFTIDDLKLLEQKFNDIDVKHQYEKVIYDAYIENNAFKLTAEQRQHAYQVYVESKEIIL